MKIIRSNPVKNLTDIEATGTLTAVEQSVKEDEMKRQERIDTDFKEKEKFTKDFIKEQDRKTNLKESFAKKIDWSEIENAFYHKLGNELDLYLNDWTERKATRGSYLIKGTIVTDKEKKDIELRSDGETLEVAIEDEKFDARTPDEFVEKIKEIFKDSLQEDMLDDKEVSVKITLKVPARWDYDKTKERIEQALDTYVPLIDVTKIEVTDSWRQLANMREKRNLRRKERVLKEKKELVDVFTNLQRELGTQLDSSEKLTVKVKGGPRQKYSQLGVDADGNILIDVKDLEDLGHAQKVADFYHLELKTKENKNKNTEYSKNYPYQGVLIIPKDVQEMEVNEYLRQFSDEQK